MGGKRLMKVIISNEITITEPTQEIMDWCKRELVLPNPDYEKKNGWDCGLEIHHEH